MPPQVVLEIKRFKIAKEVWSTSKSRRVVAFAEGLYHGKVVKSVDSKVYTGTKLCLPWTDSLQRLQVNFYFIDDLLTIDIGTALYSISEDGKFRQDTAKIDVILKIFPVGGTVPVGRVLVSISVQDIFDDENTGAHKCAVPKQSVVDHDFAVPGFRFKRLSRVLHWERIRGMNLSQTVQNNDVRTLLTCLDDVTGGDVSQEDIDPQLYKALQLAQYGSQYLLSCRKVMKDRESVLKTALKTFQQEEELLDLKLAKLRARDKALHREARDLDELTVEYSSALKEVNPRLINTLYKTYQEKVRVPSTGQLVEMADHRKLDVEDEYDGYSSEDHHRRQGRSIRQSRADRHERQRDWETAPPLSEQLGLQPREPHVYDMQTALGPRRTLRTQLAPRSSRQIGDPWASSDSRDVVPPTNVAGNSSSSWADPATHRPTDENHILAQFGQNASVDPASQRNTWKTSSVSSTKDIATNISRPAAAAAVAVVTSERDPPPHQSDDVRRVTSDSEDSGEGRPRGGGSGGGGGGGIKRVVSRTEFAAVPVQPLVRTLSVRSIAVNAEAAASGPTPDPAYRNPVPSSSTVVPVREARGGGAPLHSNSNAERGLASTARLAPGGNVQQSTGEMSTGTAMSVDSLNPRMIPSNSARDLTAERDYDNEVDYEQQQHRAVADDLSRTNESYEAVDMSSFVNASRSRDSDRDRDRDRDRDVSVNRTGISQRGESVQSVDDYIAENMRHTAREGEMVDLNATDESNFQYQVEEFDDSLHMDHRPISGFSQPESLHAVQAAAAAAAAVGVQPSTISISTSAVTPGRAPLLPPSASKSTPKRPSNRGPLSPDDYEYSMDGDSPFPDLSAAKDYNRILGGPQRQNHSHISSNASVSHNFNRSGLSNTGGGEDSYDLDAFEDEDDPFGRGSSGPQRTLDLTNVTGGSTDIDASKSITIDFMLPSESKDVQRHAPGHSSDGAKYGSHRNSRYEEPDISGELDLFSPLGGPRSVQFGATRASGNRGGGGGGRDDDEDDDVLMGTTKLSSGTARDFNNTFQSRGGMSMGMGGSDRFEQDSLGGTFASSQGGGQGKGASFSPMLDADYPKGSRDTRDTDHGDGEDEEEEEEEEESIPPPTYDAMIGTGNTEDSLLASSASQVNHSLDQDVSSYFEVSAEATHAAVVKSSGAGTGGGGGGGGASAPHHLDIHTLPSEAEAAGILAPRWHLGRAPVDAIELAAAFDVFVSAVRLDAQHARIYSEIQIKIEFLGIMSQLSSVVDLSRTQSVQPVSFSAHMIFTPEQEELLQEEIAELDDAISCQVHVIDAVTQEIVGTASVQLWVMVEDSVNILRQEVEVLNLDLSSEMGSALVDIKGFRLLKKCANAQRHRRTGH